MEGLQAVAEVMNALAIPALGWVALTLHKLDRSVYALSQEMRFVWKQVNELKGKKDEI